MALFTLSGAVIAGGAGQRMGRNKATLWIAGEPLVRRQLRILHEVGVSERLVSLGIEGELGVTLDPDVRVVRDVQPDGGPLAGLERILATAQGDQVVVLAVDLPTMEAGFLRDLISGCRPARGVVPIRDGRYEPLAAVYPRRAHAEARARLARGELALQGFVEAGIEAGWLQSRVVTPAEAAYLTNWNRPGDFSPDCG